jgi:serine-type D-Ala-D-Ala carboxypeptidase/endopeptidase (penicillin-binding protein 4)
MAITKRSRRWVSLTFAWAFLSCLTVTPAALAQSMQQKEGTCCGAKPRPKREEKSPTAAQVARFTARAEALLGAGPASKGAWGLLIVDEKSGETLYARNADKYFVPASNLKLFTTALALAKLGPDYRFRTTLETHGTLSPEGLLTGDLILVGRGDPNLSNRKFPFVLKEEFDGPPEKALAELADALVAKGVKEISGDLVGDDSYFPRERYPSGWEIDDMVWQYGAAISAIVVDDNTVTLTLTPGERAGDPVLSAMAPATPDFTIENDVVTSAAQVKADLTLTREPGTNLVVVRGTLPAKTAPRKLVLAVEEPAQHAATLLTALLADRGVKIAGKARAVHVMEESAATAPPRTVLAEHVSVPLGEAVKLVNKISQNLHSEMLLRAAARQNGLWSTPEDLEKFPEDFYSTAGIFAGDVVQTDGSGLSRRDLVTPRAVVALLKYAKEQPWFEAYYASLPVAGEDGSLEDRMKSTVAVGKIHAKTGSLEHVRTRSGYAEAPGGRRLIFSFLSNNMGGKNHEATDALDGLCVAMIEEFNGASAEGDRGHMHPK